MNNSILKSLAVVGIIISLMACGKKGSDGASVNSPRDPRVSGPMVTPTGQGSPGAVSNIQFATAQAAQIKDAVQVLVSATMDPSAVGDINSIEVSGNIGFQSNGQVTNDSAFQIVIKDSYVGTTDDGTQIDPIVIRVSNATGTVYNGKANITFSDSYGTIIVTGTWDQSNTFNGVVNFQNKTSKVANKTNGTLGGFNIPVCSFFRCLAQ